MKKLIINADDGGHSREVDRAIVRCLDAGTVTGVSLMPAGDNFAQMRDTLLAKGQTDVGVHATLTGRFRPCSEDVGAVSTLVEEGCFTENYFSFMNRLARGDIDPRQIYAELKSQIDRIVESGLRPVHIDSHEHVHMFHHVLVKVIDLALEYDIKYIRLPYENARVMRRNFNLNDFARHMGLKFFSKCAVKEIRKSGLRYNDGFAGHFHSGRVNKETLRFLLDTLQDGITEIAMHPADVTDEFIENNKWYAHSGEELDALTDPALKKEIEKRGIKLVSHADVV